MEELIVNLHMHTPYSDGHRTHAEIALAAIKTGLDAVITTDHNVWVNGIEGYFQSGNRRVLVLVGEEVHDPLRQPQKNHLMIFGAGRELCMFAGDPQRLIDQARLSDGLAFIAHPFEDELPAFHEEDLGWVDWQVSGYTGLEIWNGFSEFKTVSQNIFLVLFHAFFPRYMPHSPLERTLHKWDELLAGGKRVVGIGGADAHALPFRLGPLHIDLYPYEFHFRCINNHLLVPDRLTGDLASDRKAILAALRQGHLYVGYDLPASTRGFRFTAQGKEGMAAMGDEIAMRGGVTFQIRLPAKADCRLLLNGKVLKNWMDREICTYIANQAGVYRVEVYINYLGKTRGWIFSNPIYVTP